MRTFLTIWTKPTETFEYLIRKEKDDLAFNLNTLFFLGSLAMAIPTLVGKSSATDIYEFTFGYTLINIILAMTIFQGIGLLIKYLAK